MVAFEIANNLGWLLSRTHQKKNERTTFNGDKLLKCDVT